MARLLTGELDVAFVHPPPEHAAALGCVDISIEPLVVAIPSTCPLSRRRRIRREQLAGVPLMYFPCANRLLVSAPAFAQYNMKTGVAQSRMSRMVTVSDACEKESTW